MAAGQRWDIKDKHDNKHENVIANHKTTYLALMFQFFCRHPTFDKQGNNFQINRFGLNLSEVRKVKWRRSTTSKCIFELQQNICHSNSAFWLPCGSVSIMDPGGILSHIQYPSASAPGVMNCLLKGSSPALGTAWEGLGHVSLEGMHSLEAIHTLQEDTVGTRAGGLWGQWTAFEGNSWLWEPIQ